MEQKDTYPSCKSILPAAKVHYSYLSITVTHSLMGILPAEVACMQMESKPTFAKILLAFFPIASV